MKPAPSYSSQAKPTATLSQATRAFRDHRSEGEGSTMVLDAPPGAGCMVGGVPPCGLPAGAPPVPVVSGPVQPCGCSWPLLLGNTVRPVLYGESPGLLSSLSLGGGQSCADSKAERGKGNAHVRSSNRSSFKPAGQGLFPDSGGEVVHFGAPPIPA
jgi:hypothetical protein